jgi:hypothetical protein
MSPGRWGRGKTLRFERARADKRRVRLLTRARNERGQGLVEFAIILPLFLMLIVGIIQFAVALNFWFDLNRLANQGARSAAVNCGPTVANDCGPTKLEYYLGRNTTAHTEGQIISSGNALITTGEDCAKAGKTGAQCSGTSLEAAEVCYVPPTPNQAAGSWTPSAGDAVRVRLKDQYRLQWIVNLSKIDLTGTATMRLEQDPTSPALPSRTDRRNWVVTDNAGGRCSP